MSGSQKLGKYELLEIIGRGGMGVVYKAVDPEIGRLVGIKIMTNTYINHGDVLKRFYREAQSAGKLQHPNIVTIYDLGVQEATPYIVMEFLEGESLAAVISSRRALSIEEKLSIVIQTCNALAYAHERGIVHRDIKPANLMVLTDGTVKIVDFGIARIGGETVTRAGQVMGSIQYMSPEQINGAHLDLRTDIFSTGVLLYELLTHVLPFEGKDPGDTLLKVIHGSPPPLAQFLEVYPPQLEGIVQRVLAKSPDERYQSAAEFAIDLSQVQEQLRDRTISQYLKTVELYFADAQWSNAKEVLLQLLRIDPRSARASVLLHQAQQRIQEQQRADRVRDLRTQAEQADARNALDEAVRYLDMAVALDESDLHMREFRDSVRGKKQRADRLIKLLQQAESAHEAGDLDEGFAAAEEALAIASNSTDAKALHAAITSELAERTRLKQIQSFVEDARRQISSGRFTVALGILEKAQRLGLDAPAIRELVTLAFAGRRQQQLLKELDQVCTDIEEAMHLDDFVAACAKAAEAVRKFPNDSRLLKLKELANRGRKAHEKRMYLESQFPLARRLAEGETSTNALIPQHDVSTKYPKDFGLRSVFSLVTENVKRKRVDLFEAKNIRQAKEAIGRKAYSEAVEILQAAHRHASSGEFDTLLQFAQKQAKNQAKRQKIDTASERAKNLISADEYGRAIELLQAAVEELNDDGLHIILSDARRHVEDLGATLQDAIAKANRLLRVQKYSEALKFLESRADVYGKLPEFWQVLEQMRRERLRVEAFSVAKEQARGMLDKDDFNAARAVLTQYNMEFGDGPDARLLEREIEAKQEANAKTSVERALKDCRVLLLVQCYQSVLDVLDKVSSVVALVPSATRMEYEVAWKTASAGVERDRVARLRSSDQKGQLFEAARRPSLSESDWPTTEPFGSTKNAGQQTQLASLTRLEEILTEVTRIAEHYPRDERIQAMVGGLKEQLTLQTAALLPADAFQETAGQAKAEPALKDVAGLRACEGSAPPPIPEVGNRAGTGLPSSKERSHPDR